MNQKEILSKEYIDAKFFRIEELLRMVLVSNISLEMFLSSDDVNSIRGQEHLQIISFDESRGSVPDGGIQFIEENNMIYHGCLRIFRNLYYLIEIKLDLKPSVIKDKYKKLKNITDGNVILIFESLIESRKRNLKVSGIPFIIK